ncbi:malonyl-ACP O-methyltransferase BioC [Thiospirillum jenense]|uniref:Malonyl-[acyl-carrier protein] O-methyltransferase n=2 Tax=Thiospirillum jenense TaxID=1653858 RepID=A0A839H6A4_9GAMM|nr:malonyl-ACP O-methyltransferase BioC [Thiospirillum jenense]
MAPPPPPAPPIDKSAARRAFDRAAPHYDQYAILQQELNCRLLERLDLLRIQPQRILDLGCGTGTALPDLCRRYPTAEVIALDFAPAMLTCARQQLLTNQSVAPTTAPSPVQFLCADVDALPLAPRSVDLIFSNATLQWSNALEATLATLAQVLRPGGAFLFNTFGVDTLHELRSAWAAVDSHPHVSEFFDLHDIGDALLRVGFAEPVMDAERIVMTYANLRDLMRDLKGIGAHNPLHQRARGLTSRARFAALERAYQPWRHPDGRWPATWEVTYGLAWQATVAQSRPSVAVALPLTPRQQCQPPDATAVQS